METVAITNLSGDLAHPLLLGLLHAADDALAVELELELELEQPENDDWFDRDVEPEYEPEPRGWWASLWDRIRR